MVKYLSANARDSGLIPGLGRSLGGRNGNPLQYSCLGNPIDRGAWQATVHGVTKKNQTQLRDLKKKLSPCSMLGPEQDVLCWLFTLSGNINSINLGHRALGFPCSSDGKESACNEVGLGSIPGSGRSPGGGHGNSLQYSCLKNPMTEKPGGLQSIESQRVGHD